MKIKSLFAVFLLVPLFVFSQKLTEKADEAFNASQYFGAIDLYKSAYAKAEGDNALKAKIAFNVGFCYRKLSKPEFAELWFGKALDLKCQDPIAHLYYADALRVDEKIDEAIEQYNMYRKLVKNDERVELAIKSCIVAKNWIQNPTKYEVTNNAFINSEYSDYCVAYTDTTAKNILFSSSRKVDDKADINLSSGQPFSNLYESSKDETGSWSTPKKIDGPVNSDFDAGSPSISSDFTEMYFTRCEGNSTVASCNIYVSTKSGKGWGKPELLQITSNKNDTFLFAHPAISPDGLRLYFVSDMPGGKGGYDIWYKERATKDAKWSDPENAGEAINSQGDEMYPYVRSDGVFYFSSNGHHGMGGFDIFRVNKDPKGKDQIVNLMYPLNTPADDFGIVFEKGAERGFLSSNRKGSKGLDDIWQFSIPPLVFSVKCSLVDENTDLPVVGAQIRLVGNDGTSAEVETDKNGKYAFTLKPSTNYVLLATKKGYLIGKGKISTDGLEKNKDFKLNVYMNKIDIPIELPNIMYDVEKWDLRPESVSSLEKMIEILNDNPTITIELSSHTDFRVSSKISNQDLSQKRAQSVVDFLIAKGIDPKRLIAKGYGANKPKVVDRKTTFLYPMFKEGTVLNKDYIEKLPNDKKEIAHQINRRTEFKVTSTNFTK